MSHLATEEIPCVRYICEFLSGGDIDGFPSFGSLQRLSHLTSSQTGSAAWGQPVPLRAAVGSFFSFRVSARVRASQYLAEVSDFPRQRRVISQRPASGGVWGCGGGAPPAPEIRVLRAELRAVLLSLSANPLGAMANPLGAMATRLPEASSALRAPRFREPFVPCLRLRSLFLLLCCVVAAHLCAPREEACVAAARPRLSAPAEDESDSASSWSSSYGSASEEESDPSSNDFPLAHAQLRPTPTLLLRTPQPAPQNDFLSRLWDATASRGQSYLDAVKESFSSPPESYSDAASQFISASGNFLQGAFDEARDQLATTWRKSQLAWDDFASSASEFGERAWRTLQKPEDVEELIVPESYTPLTDAGGAGTRRDLPPALPRAALAPFANVLPSVLSAALQSVAASKLAAEVSELLGTEETAQNWAVASKMLRETGKLDPSHPAVVDLVQKVVVAVAVMGAALDGLAARSGFIGDAVRASGVSLVVRLLKNALQRSPHVGSSGADDQDAEKASERARGSEDRGADDEEIRARVVSEAIHSIKSMPGTGLEAIERKYQSILTRAGVLPGQLKAGLRRVLGNGAVAEEPDSYASVYAPRETPSAPARLQTPFEDSDDE
ncbi:hypothetical protein BESB_030980 [Besnoitia besnoiti]|uniref:Uncharacterized protein n=1 Tax=Besnoitia besnoiti TaxID=94643 RepID=A0A2A9M1V4_BESBE|nr:hypothetical protein BESB_030980 [Besnoitia besnoiti]PFH31224.1 hypothetical protein BESB_030980 [Besnoitia besnoiti]